MSGKNCLVLWGVFITVVLQPYISDHSKQLVQNELENVADKTFSQPSEQNKGMHFPVKSWVKFENLNFMIAWVWLIKIYTHVADFYVSSLRVKWSKQLVKLGIRIWKRGVFDARRYCSQLCAASLWSASVTPALTNAYTFTTGTNQAWWAHLVKYLPRKSG